MDDTTVGATADSSTADTTADTTADSTAGPGADPLAGSSINGDLLERRHSSGRTKRTEAAKRRRLRLVVVAVVFFSALGFLLYEGIGSALNYYLTVPQALAQKESLGSRSFRLEGVVAPGSIRKAHDGVDFAVTGGGHRVDVLAAEQPPQLFQVGIRVVLVGHFQANYFWTNRIMVKHSSVYAPATKS
ncbi:MAG: cytochrome c maturation protein CcmE [Acidimicrobiales bacterium]